MRKYVCSVCSFVFDEASGIPESGIAPGTKWEDFPDGWVCPVCGALKEEFQEQEATITPEVKAERVASHSGGLRAL